MQKFLISIIGTLSICSAFAVSENVPTSKSYVDSEITQKQDKIAANNGVTQVLTNTGTAGEYGTKGIYDANGAYATQTQNLVDAATMNAGVQNAIDSEFQCIEYDENNECLLMQLGGITQVPAGYTQLKYLESDGNQWIDTDIYFDSSKNYRIIGKAININLSERNVIFGAYSNDNKSINFEFGGRSNRAGYFRIWYGTVDKFSTYVLPINSEITYSAIYDSVSHAFDTMISYDDTFQNMKKNLSISGVSPSPFRFFRDNRSSPNQIANPLRIGNHKIYIDNILVHNFIPARRNSDGVLGMYDTVSNTFFTNKGTGEFIAGPVVYIPQSN